VFAWLKLLVRSHALPEDATRPARVDFVGKVLSSNTTTSPFTSFQAALIEVVLVDWETIQMGSGSLTGPREVERFTPLGGCRWGSGLVIADANGRELYIESTTAPRVVPLSPRPLALDTPVPPELVDAARLSQHLLSYRETRFCEGDRVRVIATVVRGRISPQAGVMSGFAGANKAMGYRDGSASVLVPADRERLELHELV
jgi:hypothetical protein